MALLEAMAWGLPVVASGVGAIPEVLDGGRCGLVVPPGDVGALAAAMVRAVSENGHRWGDEARRRISERYSAGRMAEQYREVYLQLASRGAPAATLASRPRGRAHRVGVAVAIGAVAAGWWVWPARSIPSRHPHHSRPPAARNAGDGVRVP